MSELEGRVLAGRYRIDAFLGKGGMAEVYKAWDTARSTYLALKVLHADLAEDKVFVRRFRREAETLATLQHPNIVRFYGMEQDGDLVFILMDYVDGTNLRKEIFCSKEPFSAQRILEVMRPVCSALHYAHMSGYVHCDVKPGNIMISAAGTVLVADFGIARVSETSTATMVGAGTPAYMAPEQVKGANPSPQTDIYALGLVLYEMLTGGERPFTGERAQVTGSTGEKVRWEQVKLPPPPLKQFNPAISPALEAVVMRCLQKDPAQRYEGVQEFLTALQAALPVAAPATSRTSAGFDGGHGPAATTPDPRHAHEAAAAPEAIGPAAPRKMPSLVAVAAIAVGLCALSIAAILSAPALFRPAPPTATPTPQPTWTPLPTYTPYPTPTPVPPTPIPQLPPRILSMKQERGTGDNANKIYMHFTIVDPNSDANYVTYEIIDKSANANLYVKNGSFSAAGDQTTGATFYGTWTCGGGYYFATLSATVRDAHSNVSEPYVYTVRCP